ncbi:hypothetical protein Patl1_23324 [Pistacia atlantica]|uniref:Uncharacterized protein n=1 Tax=Pistacia atlantica TaxID=434234 RepID=A0ACC1A305_9ROSI|nr:hypothetical protein Patl1_23324 [Pistacia atlantica]
MAEEKIKIRVPRVKLGNQGLEVSKLGYGCMTLSGGYNSPLSEEEGIAVIKDVFNKGITFLDTADVYGQGANEVLVGKVHLFLSLSIRFNFQALKQLPREKIQLATKFGILGLGSTDVKVKGTPEYVRSACEDSLQRLGVEYIDLYYQHRIDTSIPIEETIGELKKLVEEGKVKYIGLSEASPDTIRRAHAVHPITAVQLEWSLWSRDIEEEIVPLCRELGIGIVPYSPLGRGFFGGKGSLESLPAVSSLNTHPRFKAENLDKNKKIYASIENLAKKHNCTPSQLALAWVLGQGDDVVPIPGSPDGVCGCFSLKKTLALCLAKGKIHIEVLQYSEMNLVLPSIFRCGHYFTVIAKYDAVLNGKCLSFAGSAILLGTTKIKNLDNNIGSLLVKLTKENLKEISDAIPIAEVAGDRAYDSMRNVTWKFANTPPRGSKV